MQLLIDAQALQSPGTRDRGIGRYARSLIGAIAAGRPGWQIRLAACQNLEFPDLSDLPTLEVRPFTLPFASDSRGTNENGIYYGDWLAAQAATAILLPCYFDTHVVVPRFMGRHPGVYGILYDLIPLLFSHHYLREHRETTDYAERFRRMLEADCLLAISEASARDLRTVCPQNLTKLVTIGGAADPPPHFTEAELEEARKLLRAKYKFAKEFVLYVGGFDYRKNLLGAMQGFACLPVAMREQFDLVIVCRLSSGQRRLLQDEADRLRITQSLKLPGAVTQKELDALYHLCRVFFFPSLYEGLGIPVLEALGCGAPVVAANTSSIPEFAGDAARLFDPRAPEKAGETLAEALREPRDFGRVRRLAQAQKFTWSATATLACQAIESAVPPRTSRLMQRRVAWVSPLPPAPTGIADYSTEVLQTLAGRFDIELIVDPALDQAADSLTAQFPVLRADEAASRHDARPYDLFIYQLGNSHFHSYMLPLMFRYRGLVVMHDYFLGGLVLPLIRAGQWPGTLAEEVERDGHPELARSLRRRAITEVDALDGAPLNRRILKLAEMAAVHSNWALQRTRALVSAPVVKLCPAVRMPPPRTRSAERARLGLPADAFVVSTIGVVGPAKRIPSLLRAVAALPEGMRRQIVLPIVGPGPDEHLQELKHLARDLGLEPALRLTGRVPLEDLTAHARAADVCVQLRYPTRGESSAALLRELAAGAACIISDHGSIAEVAAEAVLRVRVPDHEVEDLANALRQLYEHPQLREALGKRAAEYARSHHRLELLAEQYANLIELMAARHMAGDWAWQQEACHALMHISQEQEARRVLEKWAELRVGGKTASHDL